MQREIVYNRLDQFITALKQQNIEKVAFTEINEKRPVQIDAGTLQVSDLIICEILAYRDSTLYKCRIQDADLEQIYESMVLNGFDITRRNRNIT